jgi:hypothetical protein
VQLHIQLLLQLHIQQKEVQLIEKAKNVVKGVLVVLTPLSTLTDMKEGINGYGVGFNPSLHLSILLFQPLLLKGPSWQSPGSIN